MEISFRLAALLTMSAVLAGRALATETQTYIYDELGRLIAVTHSGTINNGLKASYCHDPASNRTKYKSDAAGASATCEAGPPPTPVVFAINNAAGTEGGTLVFTVTKAGTASSSVSVNFATAHGTANAQDYFSQSGNLTFAANENVKTISVVTKTDTTAEPDQIFYLNLSGATGGATFSDSQGAGTIYDDGGGSCPLCRTAPPGGT